MIATNRRISLFFASMLILAVGGVASASNNNEPQTQPPALDAQVSVTSHPLLTQVSYRALSTLPRRPADKTLVYGNDPLQKIDIWRKNAFSTALEQEVKSEGRGSETFVIFVHGGCWQNAYDLTHAGGFYYALASRGISVYSLEYRRTGDAGGGWPGSLNDVTKGIQEALRSISNEAEQAKVFIVGHSAGGHLALLGSQVITHLPENVQVKAVIGLAAITNIVQYAKGTNSCQRATTAFMGGAPSTLTEAYHNATPASEQSAFPIWLMHTNDDVIVPLSQSVLSGTRQTHVSAGGHFDWLHPQSLAFQSLMKVIEQI